MPAVQHLGSETPTNVAKLFWSRPGKSEKKLFADDFKIDSSTGNVAIYIRGIGTVDTQYIQEPQDRNWWEEIWWRLRGKGRELQEQVTGTTIVDRVKRSYDFFLSVYEQGDDIVLVGFSRGAASIRILASELVKRHKVVIKYMLVFDTVYSVMGEISILNNAPINRFTDFDISPAVLRCDHLIAGDELREKFPFSPVNKREGVRQILFPGSHSDVGGGHKMTGLSDIALQYSLQQLELLGWSSDPASVAALKIAPNPVASITYVILGGTGQRQFPRKLTDTDFLVHRSIIERSQAKETVSIALAQLSTFTASSSEELIEPKYIDSSFDF